MAYTQKNSCIHHVTLIGPIASGKSCLKDAMIGVPFETDHQSTIGMVSEKAHNMLSNVPFIRPLCRYFKI